MNRKPLLISLLVIGLIVASFAYLTFTNSSDQSQETSAPKSSTSATEASPQPQSLEAKPGAYINYSADAIASTSGAKAIFFHAPWCPQCRRLEADVKDGGIPADTTIFKADYDSSQSLRQQYGVTIQTTVVRVDDDGQLIKKYVAYDDPTLENVIKNLEL